MVTLCYTDKWGSQYDDFETAEEAVQWAEKNFDLTPDEAQTLLMYEELFFPEGDMLTISKYD